MDAMLKSLLFVPGDNEKKNQRVAAMQPFFLTGAA